VVGEIAVGCLPVRELLVSEQVVGQQEAGKLVLFCSGRQTGGRRSSSKQTWARQTNIGKIFCAAFINHVRNIK